MTPSPSPISSSLLKNVEAAHDFFPWEHRLIPILPIQPTSPASTTASRTSSLVLQSHTAQPQAVQETTGKSPTARAVTSTPRPEGEFTPPSSCSHGIISVCIIKHEANFCDLRQTKAGDFEGVGGPEDKTAAAQVERGGDQDVSGNVRQGGETRRP